MKLSKKFIAIAFFFISINVSGQWTPVYSGTTLNLKQVVFPDSLTGYILTSSSSASMPEELLKTTDGGNTWIVIFSGHVMNNCDFIDADTGVVVNNDTIFKTFDGGNTWSAFYSAGMYNPELFHMNTVDEWFYIRSESSKFTTDGGVTWYPGDTLGFLPVVPTDFHFINDTIVMGVGWYSPEIFKSIDRGLHWSSVSFLNVGFIWSVCFPTLTTGFITSSNRIYKSVDGGVNWITIDSTLGFNINCLRHIDVNNFYGVGYGGGIAKSSDGGNSWTSEISGTTNNLNKIIFINSHTAIAIGDSGTILMNIHLVSGIEKVNSNQEIISVFPTPSKNRLSIQNNSNQLLKFSFYNTLGEKIIEKILTEEVSSINLSDYTNGIYLYTLIFGNRIIKTGKIIKQ